MKVFGSNIDSNTRRRDFCLQVKDQHLSVAGAPSKSFKDKHIDIERQKGKYVSRQTENDERERVREREREREREGKRKRERKRGWERRENKRKRERGGEREGEREGGD